MPIVHRARRGDCFASIAAEHGFFVETLWNLPENAELRASRPSPYVLVEGDEVFIPDRRPREEPAETARRHTFRRRGVPEQLRIQIQGQEGPRPGLTYWIAIDGGEERARRGKTDDEGWIVQWIPPGAREAKIAIGDPVEEVLVVGLGQLAPPDTEAGARARLVACGFLRSTDADAALYALALMRFQEQQGLPVSGELDAETAAALRAFHGS